MFGANTLHVETAPGRGDYRPAEMGYGTALRFNGAELWHKVGR